MQRPVHSLSFLHRHRKWLPSQGINQQHHQFNGRFHNPRASFPPRPLHLPNAAVAPPPPVQVTVSIHRPGKPERAPFQLTFNMCSAVVDVVTEGHFVHFPRTDAAQLSGTLRPRSIGFGFVLAT